MRREEHEADHLARDALIEQIAHGEEIAQGFGHLLALDLQHLIMHPDARKLPLGVRAAALRDLVLVVGEHQVVAAAVDVEALAQKRMRHGRAFDMPAGPPATPGAVPSR